MPVGLESVWRCLGSVLEASGGVRQQRVIPERGRALISLLFSARRADARLAAAALAASALIAGVRFRSRERCTSPFYPSAWRAGARAVESPARDLGPLRVRASRFPMLGSLMRAPSALGWDLEAPALVDSLSPDRLGSCRTPPPTPSPSSRASPTSR